MRTCKLAFTVLGAAVSISAVAASPLERHQQQLAMELQASGTGFGGFSAQRGEEFFSRSRGVKRARFADLADVDKWLARSCNDALRRVCTSQEKGDILQYLKTVSLEGRK